MPGIRIGVVGRITAGRFAGEWVRIDDDSDSTGGFLVFQSEDGSFTQAGDQWVEDRASLDEYFAELGWVVAWADEAG